jgi:P4 family phage/plasmid primase-like protien
MSEFIPEQLQPLTLWEPVNEANLCALLECKDLLSRISQKSTRNLYVQLGIYKEIPLTRKGRAVKYGYSIGSEDGRMYAKNSGGTSLQGMDIQLRHCLAHGELRDIDVKSCHPTLYRQFLEKCGRPCPLLKQYSKESKEVRSRMCEQHGIDMDTAKKTMLAITYGSRLVVKGTDTKITDAFVVDYSKELREHNEYISKLFPERYDKCVADKKPNPESSCASQVMCLIENGVLKVMYEVATAMNMVPSVLSFDGLMVRKLADSYMSVAQAAILERTGYEVTLEEKPIAQVSVQDLYDKYPQEEEEEAAPVVPIIIPQLSPRGQKRKDPPQSGTEPLCRELMDRIEALNGGDVGLADLVFKMRGNRLKNVGGDDQRCKFYAYNPKLRIYSEVDRSYVMVEEISRPLQVYIRKIKNDRRYILRVRYLEEVAKNSKARTDESESNHAELLLLKGVDKMYESLTSTKTLVNVLKLVMSTCRDTEFESKLDANPHVLAVRNGIVDLRTGNLRPRVEEDYITKVVDMDYDPNHPGLQRVVDLVDQITLSTKLGRPEYIQYLQRLLGYALTGLTVQQVVVFCIGNGANGKGVMEDLVRMAMGPYHYSAPPDIIRAGGKTSAGAASPHIADCYKKRVAWLDELPDCLIDQQLFKSMSGGAQITARQLYGNHVTFNPTHTLFVNSNHMPRMKLDAYSLRRVVCLPFDMEARYEDDADEEMRYNPGNPRHVVRRDNLLEGFPWAAALTWMVQGAVAYYEEGLGQKPACCEAKQDEFKAENDKLAQFIEERCCTGDATTYIWDPEGRCIEDSTQKRSVLASRLLTRYNAFRKSNRLGEVKAKDLVIEMKAKGFLHCKSKARDFTRDKYIFEGIIYNGEEFD